jgi:hypothetical protein
MSIDAMKQALEALENADVPSPEKVGEHLDAITALRTAIEQAEKQGQCKEHGECFGGKCIYTTPPAAQRQPLTKERIGQIIEQCKITLVNYCSGEKQIEFARAIEAAHGIK